VDMARLVESGAGRVLLKGLARLMESRFRYRFFAPDRILQSAGVPEARRVLEIGCGTGFFTLPAARLMAGRGRVVAIDVLQESVDRVTRRVADASLTNVDVLRADALDTGLDAASFDLVLLFGVIPAPMLDLDDLLSEIRRMLRDGGELAVWPWIPLWLPDAVVRAGLFAYLGRRDGVSRFIARHVRPGNEAVMRG
jgi:ubiquinone/menaquinone biosynthesis C-methylase UbiE